MNHQVEDLVQSCPSHYERLGIPATADAEALRQAFRRRSKALHPDTTTLPADVAAVQFQQLRRSYDVLADPELRRRYDEQLRPQDTQHNRPSPLNPDRDGWHGIGERRPLSGGEYFSLLLLAVALLLCLLFGLGVAATQGRAWQVSPGWMAVDLPPLERDATASQDGQPVDLQADVRSADGSDTAEPTFSARLGTVVTAVGCRTRGG